MTSLTRTKDALDSMLHDLQDHPKHDHWNEEAGQLHHGGNLMGLRDLHDEVEEAWRYRWDIE